MQKPRWSDACYPGIFAYLAELLGLLSFVETGTSDGNTAAYLAPHYGQVFTIENNPGCYARAVERFAHTPNVHCILGDSAAVLADLVHKVGTRTLFFLDAHGNLGEDNGPLAQEIAAITAHRPHALIAVDDVGPHGHHDVTLSAVREAGVSLDGYRLDYRFGRILFVYRPEIYSIPAFD